MDPVTASLLAAGIGAAGSAAGGYLSGAGNAAKETKMQKTQRKLVDKLIASLSGQGPYADLFAFDQDIFNKSFVEPAKAKFRNQIAPQIQQSFIASGQQRGTGLDDTLTRAGVDLDSMLNQYLYESQQGALNRKQNTIANILGMPAGAPNRPSSGQNIMSGLGGFLASPAFSDSIGGTLKPQQQYQAPRPGYEQQYQAPRPGYEQQYQAPRPGYEPQYGAGGYYG
jgi:hypothetical protein